MQIANFVKRSILEDSYVKRGGSTVLCAEQAGSHCDEHSAMDHFFIRHRLDKFCMAMDKNIYISSLRHGLILSIPFFLFGSLALVLLNFPVQQYQIFINTAMSGLLAKIFYTLFQCGMGAMTLIMLISVSYSFGKLADAPRSGTYPLACLNCYFLFVINPDSTEGIITFDMFGSDWLFTAMIITLTTCALLRRFLAIAQKVHDRHYHEGIDLDFQNVMVSLVPIAGCIAVFVFVKLFFVWMFGSVNLHNIGGEFFMDIFKKIGTGFPGALLFIFLIHILWFFGIHGSNLLGVVSVDVFELGMLENVEAAAQGLVPEVLFTKTFFDCFVLMGGSGATLGLLLALAIANRKNKGHSLLGYALLPSIFNINELVLFGLPVVFNPVMLIPFIMVPIILLCTSAFVMYIGLVPVCCQAVTWTCPIIYSGYVSTGSWAGAILQAVNLLVAAAIYLPFIKLSEQYYSSYLKETVKELRDTIVAREETGNTSSLHSAEYRNLQDVIKLLTEDLRHALHNRKISLYYQPQFNHDGTLHGLEALLRWKHPSLGYQYPPMVIDLAREDGMLNKMGYRIIETAACALERLSQEVKYPIVLAVNISPDQLESATFCDWVSGILHKHNFHGSRLCFEVTEQLALGSTDVVKARIHRLNQMGIAFHMDDFGMGHSSMTYLQYNAFDTVKLDGTLVKDMEHNPRSRDIIRGISQMSSGLNYHVIAEYVETTEQRELLHELGCDIYQGYLYSPALELPKLEIFLHEHGVIDKPISKKPSVNELHL